MQINHRPDGTLAKTPWKEIPKTIAAPEDFYSLIYAVLADNPERFCQIMRGNALSQDDVADDIIVRWMENPKWIPLPMPRELAYRYVHNKMLDILKIRKCEDQKINLPLQVIEDKDDGVSWEHDS